METATQATHTPGPWELEKTDCRSLGSVHYAIKTSYKASEHQWSPRFIAWMAGSLGESHPSRKMDDYRDDPMVEADARLIACAPDMLSALQELAQIAREYVAEGIPRLDAAIEKAAFVALKARGELL